MQSKHNPIQEYSRYGKPLKPGMWEYLYSDNHVDPEVDVANKQSKRKTLADYDLRKEDKS